jgi:uncharacterized membrane protein YcjF (UPF0283 family)
MRHVVIVLALAFIIAMAALTIDDFATNGVTGLGVVGAGVVIVCGVGILGALLQRPRR